METKIPFTVIGGYLGVGKTTLLNHILRHNQGQRIALLINDFGSINIDAELIESADGDVINLANGCICCSLAAGFLIAINTILQQDPLPDRVIVEASGVSDPSKIAPYGLTPGFTLDGVIVVVDTETVQSKAVDKYIGKTVLQQLKSADLIILNKTDLVTNQYKQEVIDWLRQTSPQCRIIEAQYGVVGIDFLLGSAAALQPPTSQDNNHDHTDDSAYQSWSYVSDTALTLPQIERFVNKLPKSILRAKGVLYLEEKPDQQMIFQLVGQRWSLTPGFEWGNIKPKNQWTAIGLQNQFDPSELSQLLEDCTLTPTKE